MQFSLFVKIPSVLAYIDPVLEQHPRIRLDNGGVPFIASIFVIYSQSCWMQLSNSAADLA
jgi:hypothetical protein